MVKRFFVILQRNWTYEADYGMEVARMIFINLVCIGIPALIYRIPNLPDWIFWVFGAGTALVFWWCYFGYSLVRMIQINENKKYARLISKSQLGLLFKAYSKQIFYAKINGRYVKITSLDDLGKSDSIELICLGKKSIVNYPRIIRILEDKR